jgi:hypothetical protein
MSALMDQVNQPLVLPAAEALGTANNKRPRLALISLQFP